ncbi:MAG: glycine--tRNA ligase subunit beta [Elusimicrobiota bacterium]|nr:glycine--tRNA ligase subunit beta [Elusimicrobiota bacterium]
MLSEILDEKKPQCKDAVLEIGVEELPVSYIRPALAQMQTQAQKFFDQYQMDVVLKTFATPRKLVLYISNLPEKSKDAKEEILGPSLKSAKDANGNFTQSAKGFANKYGILPEHLSQKQTDKGVYLAYIKNVKGVKTSKILEKIFPQIISNISFAKTMVWEQSGFRFARPIRSILAVYDKRIVRFQIADVKSSNQTFGLRSLPQSKISISQADQYFLKLKNKSVIVDQDERKEMIKDSIAAAVANAGKVVEDGALLEEVTFLVEYPTAILCGFDKKYLALPKEVLNVCLKKSQKCFSVTDNAGQIINYFIGIRNGLSQFQEIVKQGYQKVVAARLSDAEFFYKNDLQKGLSANIEKLKGLIFNKEIGTVYEKMERVEKLSCMLWDLFKADEGKKEDLKKAVWLAKADLVSEMVFEYPELQGIIGEIYAQKLGENAEVSQAIRQHYFPLSAYGALPDNEFAICIALSDKIDSLAASFAVGLEPSGSADPYALRRASIGIIRLMMEYFGDKNLSAILVSAFNFLPDSVKAKAQTLKQGQNAGQRLESFFWQRIENLLLDNALSAEEKEKNSVEDVKAIISACKKEGLSSLADLPLKLQALKTAKAKADFSQIAMLFKRINNILAQAQKQNIEIADSFDETIFETPQETELAACIKNGTSVVGGFIAGKDYGKVFDFALGIKPSIDNFFEKVMVMCPEENLKKNRIALLNNVNKIFSHFIDFGSLQ